MKLLTVLLGVFCLAYGLSAAPITSGALPDETVLLDSSDPFGLGYKFTMSGVDYYWTNQPTVVEKDVTALTALGASNTVYVGWFQGLWSKSNEWNAAFAWGDWSASVASNTAAIVVLQTNTVPVTATNGWTVTSHDGFITTNDADRIVFNALSTNRVTRWYDPELPTRWAEWDGGTNIVIYRAEVIGTNLQVTFTASFGVLEPGDFYEIFPEVGNSAPWPLSVTSTVAGWENYTLTGQGELGGSFSIESTIPPQAGWSSEAYEGATDDYPVELSQGFNQGGATVSIAGYNYATNVECRYYLPTNAIPYEFQNIDNLQGWLNNLYAGKTDFTNHTSTASIHVPIFIGTTNELPLIANRTNGVLYVEVP